MYDVVALGEVLIDFTPYGKSEKGNNVFECNPGGAPANVLAALAKLGKNTAFIGKVGEDSFGYLLKDVLERCSISVEGLGFSKDVRTTLAFVSLSDNGDRSFAFYRNPGADMMLNETEINYDIIEKTKVFHFGSVSMTNEPSKTATLKAASSAKEKGGIVSYDPNLRILLWKNAEEARENILKGMIYADILKISDEELEFITGIRDLERGTEYLRDKYNITLIFVTLGSEGCFYRAGEITGKSQGYKVNVVDTTGAGDSFLGAAIYKILELKKSLKELTESELMEVVGFANAVGALVTTKKGAISIMPDIEEIESFMTIASKE